jgi:hypothetical protein
MAKKLYALPEKPAIDFRPMGKGDVFGVAKLLNENMA